MGHIHSNSEYDYTASATIVRKEEGGAEQLEWFTLDEIKNLSPMPEKVYSQAEYALRYVGEMSS